MKVLIMAGTRPEAIKVAPVVKEFRRHPEFTTLLCNAGQHREMIQQVLDDFSLEPDRSFDLMRPGQTLAGLSSQLFAEVDPLLEELRPDWILIQGDTTTVMVSAMCAFYRGVRIGHIEAGLRTFQRRSPFPEEINRQVVCRMADLHFAPTQRTRDNLLGEGVPERDIVLTGNTVIDALLDMRARVVKTPDLLPPEIRRRLDAGQRMVLVTGHRRENFGDSFIQICQALRDLARACPDVFLVYPVHLNPNVQEPVRGLLSGHDRILLLDPLAYKPFIACLDAAYLVLTDSGGIQEEAPALGKPVLVMREVTERPEGVEAGVSRLVGTDRETIVNEARRLLTDASAYQSMAIAANPYGDGQASRRIVQALREYSA